MTKNLIQRDREVIWHPYSQMKTMEDPLGIIRGEGVYLIDNNEKKYLDAISSWWVTLHGHAHPYIAKKVAAQLCVLEQVIFAGCTHEPAVRLAERLLEVLPANFSKIFYSDNGSTAVEVALKMAFQYWKNKGHSKTKILAFKGGYHGDTFGAMSVSGRSAFTEAFAPFLFDVIYLDLPTGKNTAAVLEQAEMAFLEFDVAAFIYEPLIQGAGGMKIYPAETLNSLLKICKDNEALVIADEVMTGFYRTGKFFASDYLEEKPDLICLSKGLTGGTMPMGVTACSKEIYEAFLSDESAKTFFHGHSFTANPLACVASLASLDLLEDADTLRNIASITASHSAFAEKLKTLDILESVSSIGTILSIELKTAGDSGYFNGVKMKAHAYFLERGILLRPLGNVLYILPPYCISQEELEVVYRVISSFLDILEAAK